MVAIFVQILHNSGFFRNFAPDLLLANDLWLLPPCVRRLRGLTLNDSLD